MKTTTSLYYLWITFLKYSLRFISVLVIYLSTPNLIHAQITMHQGFPVTYPNMSTMNPILTEEISSNYDGKEIIFIAGGNFYGANNIPTKLICMSQTGVLIFERLLNMGISTYSSVKPVVADIDNNGTKEIICSYTTSVSGQYKLCVNIFTSTGSDYGNGWPKYWNDYISAEAPVSVGDIDNDGDLEIATMVTYNTFCLFHHDGTNVAGWPKFVQTQGCTQYAVPSIADFNGDGNKDILFATDYYAGVGKLYLFNSNGSLFQNFPVSLSSTFYMTSPAGVDLYNGINKELEIMATHDNGNTTLVDLYKCNGSSVPGFPIVVPNIGGDAPQDNSIIGINESGESIQSPSANNGFQPVTFADLDQDGDIEFIITGDNEFHIYNYDGTPYANFMELYIPSEKFYSPVIADVDGDNKLDIIFTSFNKTTRTFSLHIRGWYGNSLLGTPKVIKVLTGMVPGDDVRPMFGSPTIDDIDGDGKLEILVGSPVNNNQTDPYGFVSVFDLPDASPKESIEWGMVYKNIWNNDLYFDPIKGSLPEGKTFKWYDHVCMIDNATLPTNSSINVLPGTRISSKSNSTLEIRGTFNVGNSCTFRTMDQNGDLWSLKYNAPSNYTLQDQKFIRTKITGYANTMTVNSCNFENSTVNK